MRETGSSGRHRGGAALVLVAALVAATLAGATSTREQAEDLGVPHRIAQLLPCVKTGLYRAVWEVQGSGDASPYEGRTVDDLRGVVTSDFQRGTGGAWELWGFFLQAHETDCDDDTSDGVFVYTGRDARDVSPGDLVEVDGATIREDEGPAVFVWDETQTFADCPAACRVAVIERGHGVPDAVEYAPPADPDEAGTYNEALEGMLVQVSQPVTVIAGGNQHNEVPVLRGAEQDRRHREDPAGWGDIITVAGDGIAREKCGRDGLPELSTFDKVPHDPEGGVRVVGPLVYGFNSYKVHQDDDVACIVATPGDRSSWDPVGNPAPRADQDTLTLASLNAWNLFDTVDDPRKNDEFPVAASTLDRKVKKLANAICEDVALARPDVVALQEVENAFVLDLLRNEVLMRCGAAYQAVHSGSPDDRGIDVVFLVSPRVDVLGVQPRQECVEEDRGVDYEPGDDRPDLVCPGERPHYLHPRHILELTVRVELSGEPRTLTIFNNHFKSKRPSDVCEEDDCTDWRLEQARHQGALVDALFEADPDAFVVVMGDLNDFYDSVVLDELDATSGRLRNVWEKMGGPPGDGQGSVTRYSYVFNGASQVLDHALVSRSLWVLDPLVSPRHLNVDHPAAHLARASNPYRVSDHDPLAVGLGFPP